MNKEEFLFTLRQKLEAQSVANIDNMIDFYDEMICDRIEDGMSEEEAISAMDPIDKIVSEAVLDKTIPVLVKEKVEKSRKTAKAKGTQGLWIALAIIGFPIWFPLAITFGTLLFGIYLIIWILIICLFILLASIGAGALGGLILLPYGVIKGAIGWPAILLGIGSFLFLGGLVVLLWKPICSCAVAFGKLAKRFVLSIKKLFV